MKSGPFDTRSLSSHGNRAHQQGGGADVAEPAEIGSRRPPLFQQAEDVSRDGEPVERLRRRSARDADPGGPHGEIPRNGIRRVDPEEFREEDAVARGLAQGGQRDLPRGDAQVRDPHRGGLLRPRTSAGAGRSRPHFPPPEGARHVAPDPPLPPTFPASIDFPLATWEEKNDGTSPSSSSAAAPFSSTALYSPVFGRTAPSIRHARSAPSSAIAPASSPRSERAKPNPYPVCPSPFSSATDSTCAVQRDSRRLAANPREWNRDTAPTVSCNAAVRTRALPESRARTFASRDRANSAFPSSGIVSTEGSYSGRSPAAPAGSGRP